MPVAGASRLGSVAGVTGEGELLKLRFRALRIGTGALSFTRSEALDSFLDPVELAVTVGLISVEDRRAQPRDEFLDDDDRPAVRERKP